MSESKFSKQFLRKLVNIDIERRSKKWLEVKNIEKFIKSQTQKILENSPLKEFLEQKICFDLSISLCSNLQIKKINQEFRNKDEPTNVLSFGNLDEKIIQKSGLKKAIGVSKYVFLGDIILSYEYILNEAKNHKKNFNDHLTHLILHGILHLIGNDHEEEKMAKIMESLEIKILNKLNINNPYNQ
jgi:probable rRNA maturation factor